jgi:CRISPR-associated protein Csy2
MEVQNANAQPTTWMIAAPPITAFGGMAHALALALGATSHCGFSVIHHDIVFLGDEVNGNLNPHQIRGASFIDKDDYSSKNKYALASQPTARCHMTVSMVVRFDVNDTISGSKIEQFLRGGRIAGGSIIDHKFSARDPSLVIPRAFYSDEIARRIGNGFSLRERQDLMAMQEGDKDRIDPFLRAITRPFETPCAAGAKVQELPIETTLAPPAEIVSANLEGDKRKWISPTALGYAQTTTAKERGAVRNGLPHAFAEPLIGLVEYQSIRKTPLSFWQASHPAEGVFVFTTETASDM